MNKILKAFFPLMFVVTAAGCSDDSPEGPGAEDAGRVNLTINVSDGADGSRAFRDLPGAPESGRGYIDFEEPASSAEALHSLRVILVRPDGAIEANEYISAESGVAGSGGVRLKVLGGETKKVYLIANEASVAGLNLSGEEYRIGRLFPTEYISDFRLSAPGDGQAVIDNSGEQKAAIPMAEVFDVEVKAPLTEADYEQSASLFLVRALTKFSFTISSDRTPGTDYSIEEIRISSVGRSMYLLPRNTEYSPAKYPVSAEKREITAYEVPATENHPVTFKPAGALTLSTSYTPGTELSYSPELYFAETKLAAGEVYTVSVKLAGASEYYKTDIALDNLPSLPRNTHVRVNFKVENTDISSQVVSGTIY